MLCTLDILFPSNRNIHKSSYSLCFWASDPLIDRFYWTLSIKESEAQKRWPYELLWMLWFDEKSISMYIVAKNKTGSQKFLFKQLQRNSSSRQTRAKMNVFENFMKWCILSDNFSLVEKTKSHGHISDETLHAKHTKLIRQEYQINKKLKHKFVVRFQNSR